MNSFDLSITHFINQFAHRSVVVDSLLWLVATQDLFKGALYMALFWKTWFDVKDSDTEKRGRLISTLILCSPSVLVSRGLADVLKIHIRPILYEGLHFQAPYHFSAKEIVFVSANCFPSDHAALFFTLATGLWGVSRRMGIFAFAYTLVGVCFERIYFGYHWPTDLLAGAALGIVFGLMGNQRTIGATLSRPLIAFHNLHPALFYPAAFLFTYEVAVLFEDLRSIASVCYGLLR